MISQKISDTYGTPNPTHRPPIRRLHFLVLGLVRRLHYYFYLPQGTVHNHQIDFALPIS